jgi:putative FmdB family regulatory protein
MCNKCEHKYTGQNKVADRKKSGRCPECTSADTKQVMSTPKFKTSGGGHRGEMK